MCFVKGYVSEQRMMHMALRGSPGAHRLEHILCMWETSVPSLAQPSLLILPPPNTRLVVAPEHRSMWPPSRKKNQIKGNIIPVVFCSIYAFLVLQETLVSWALTLLEGTADAFSDKGLWKHLWTLLWRATCICWGSSLLIEAALQHFARQGRDRPAFPALVAGEWSQRKK